MHRGPAKHGTVDCRGGANGPSDKELTVATVLWLTANKPEALDSKVETLFRGEGLSDVTATTLPDMSDEQEDPEGGEGALSRLCAPHHTRGGRCARLRACGAPPGSCRATAARSGPWCA